MFKQFIFNFFFVLINLQGISSLQASEEDTRFWQAFIAEGNISDNVRWYAEAQARWKDNVQTFDQGFFRPALNVALSKKASLWLGYVYADTKTANGNTFEDRWWQQFQYVSQYNDFTWSSRSRLEQRHLDVDEKTSHRFRQQARVTWPINHRNNVSYLVWDEAFWNLNDSNWAGDSGFNQNRLFTGIMWKYTKASRLEIGYLNQYVNGTNGAPNQMNHVISSFVFISF